MNYTIEQFQEEFDNAQTPEAKQSLIEKLFDSDVNVMEHKELIKEYKSQIQDLKEQLAIEEDITITNLIESGEATLYTCTKSIDEFVEGRDYYVRVDDVKSKYQQSLGDVPEALKQYIDNIKPIVWIVNDNGIGTLKYKKVIDFDFEKHFQAFVLS